MSDATPISLTPPAVPPSDGCPTPLAWREVLTAFREERRELRYETDWGEAVVWEFGNGRPLWLLPPAAGDGELFSLLAWLLREEFRCRIVHLPDPPAGGSGPDLLSGWSQRFLAILQYQADGTERDSAQPVIASGTGGLIALRAAVESPDSFDRLIVQGCGIHWPWRRMERLLLKLSRRFPGPLRRVPGWQRVIEANHRPWFPPFDADRWEFLRDNLAATSTCRFGTAMSLLIDNDLPQRLGEVACPVLVIRTEGEGAAATAAQESLLNVLPNARMEWMHSAGHYPFVTHPHRFVKLVRGVLGEPAPVSSRS